MNNLNREKEIVKYNQTGILQLTSIMSEIKILWVGLTAECWWKKKE